MIEEVSETAFKVDGELIDLVSLHSRIDRMIDARNIHNAIGWYASLYYAYKYYRANNTGAEYVIKAWSKLKKEFYL